MPELHLVDDTAFDDRLPIDLQMKSSVHFTPVDVARHAAALLAPEPGVTALDVGSGTGKLCLVAAHTVRGATFVGVELRRRLVAIAERLARELTLPNARFVHGNALDIEWSMFDSFYFYNPFAEQLFEHAFTLDQSIMLHPTNFDVYVDAVLGRLAEARDGTRVVTYHGLGAPLPAGYERIAHHAPRCEQIELWVKRAHTNIPRHRTDAAG